jgi:hypothetical protein
MHLQFTFVVYSCGRNLHFIFHNKQSLPTQDYMLNVYVLIHFQLQLLYPLVAIGLFSFLINNFFQLLNALQAFMFNGLPIVYEI